MLIVRLHLGRRYKRLFGIYEDQDEQEEVCKASHPLPAAYDYRDMRMSSFDSKQHTTLHHIYPPASKMSSFINPTTMAEEPDDSTYTLTAGNRTYTIGMSDSGVPQLHEGENRMSSLSRRACYKCGNVGHYAGMMDSWSRMEDEH